MEQLQKLAEELKKMSDMTRKPAEVLDLVWDIEAFINNRPTIYGCTLEEYTLMAQTRLKKLKGY